MTLYSFASAVAEHLSALRGQTWAAQRPQYEHFVHIRRFDGASLAFICYPIAPDRVEVKAEWPKDAEPWHVVQRMRGGRMCVTNERMHIGCTVARRRDPLAVAKEINRRIFGSGEYDAHWNNQSKKRSLIDLREREDAAFLDALAASGGRRQKVSGTEREYAVVGGLVVRPLSNGECEVRGTMDRALLLEIAGRLAVERSAAE